MVESKNSPKLEENKSEKKNEVFFNNEQLTITKYTITKHDSFGDTELFLENLAGITFYDSSIKRNTAITVFVIGIIGVIVGFIKLDTSLILIISALIGTGSAIAYFSNKDEMRIQSNADNLYISYELNFNENYDQVRGAIVEAIKTAKSKK